MFTGLQHISWTPLHLSVFTVWQTPQNTGWHVWAGTTVSGWSDHTFFLLILPAVSIRKTYWMWSQLLSKWSLACITAGELCCSLAGQVIAVLPQSKPCYYVWSYHDEFTGHCEVEECRYNNGLSFDSSAHHNFFCFSGLPLKIIFFVQRHDLASNPQLFTNDYSGIT